MTLIRVIVPTLKLSMHLLGTMLWMAWMMRNKTLHRCVAVLTYADALVVWSACRLLLRQPYL